MKTVGVRDLKLHLSEILRAVEAGETFEITKRGRSIAHLDRIPPGPPNRKFTPQEIEQALEDIDRLAQEISKDAIPGVTVEQLINDIRS